MLIIDEIGPLEFGRNAGWTASFGVLEGKEYQLAIVVIRPAYIGAFFRLGFGFQIKQLSLQPP